MKSISIFIQSLKETFKKKIFVIPLIFALIYFFYTISYPEIGRILSDTYHIDKIAHVAWGLVIGGFFTIYLGKIFPKRKKLVFVICLVAIAIIGSLKELFDIYVLNAYFSVGDMIVNYLGFIAYFIFKK